MARHLAPVRGMRDVFPPISYAHEFVRNVFARKTSAHGFEPVEMPIVERSSLFLGRKNDSRNDLSPSSTSSPQQQQQQQTSAHPPEPITASKGTIEKVLNNRNPNATLAHETGSVAAARGSDMAKEMFLLAPRGDRAGRRAEDEEMCLRPEGTAGLLRAVLAAHGTDIPSVGLRLRYADSMFRYERPQKGRHRQFTQVGVELVSRPLGTDSVQRVTSDEAEMRSTYLDVECLAAAEDFLRSGLGISSSQVVLQLNTLGDRPSRHAHSVALTSFLERHRTSLSADNLRRLDSGNALRVLDSIGSCTQSEAALLQDAPVMSDFLTPGARARFEAVRHGLDSVDIPFDLNPHLVRGLDYYSHTVFEFVARSSCDVLGQQQGTVLAGGRYDGLCREFGIAQSIPAIGWAAGLERLVAVSPLCQPLLNGDLTSIHRKPVAVMLIGDKSESVSYVRQQGLSLSNALRTAGIRTTFYSDPKHIKAQLHAALSLGAPIVVIIGSEELASGFATVKLMDAGLQRRVPFESVVDFVTSSLDKAVEIRSS